MAGAFHGVGEPDCEIHVGVSGPGVVRAALTKYPDASINEIADIIKNVLSLDDDDKNALVEECVTALKDNDGGAKLFYAQFIQIWTSHEDEEEELSAYLQNFVRWTGIAFAQDKRKAILKALAGGEGLDECLYGLAEWMGDDALKYFVVGRMGDVSDLLSRKRSQKRHGRRRSEVRGLCFG